jgi:site-specific recombinase XerD
MPGFHRGCPPRNKGLQYPADSPTIEEIVAVMRKAGDTPHGLRTRALIVLLWRAGLRITEALSLAESDGMGRWAWQHLHAWLEIPLGMRVGALLCVVDGPTAGRQWSPTATRATLRELAAAAGVRRRFAPHQLRHAHAVEIARSGR